MAGLGPPARHEWRRRRRPARSPCCGRPRRCSTPTAARTEAAARLAAEAASEARHAVALAAYLLAAASETDATSEDLVLEWESGPRPQAAMAAGTAADLSGGPRAATDRRDGGGRRACTARAEQQTQDLQQRDEQISALEAEIRDLDSRLAGASNEAQSLSERLEARERARQQLQTARAGLPDRPGRRLPPGRRHHRARAGTRVRARLGEADDFGRPDAREAARRGGDLSARPVRGGRPHRFDRRQRGEPAALAVAR